MLDQDFIGVLAILRPCHPEALRPTQPSRQLVFKPPPGFIGVNGNDPFLNSPNFVVVQVLKLCVKVFCGSCGSAVRDAHAILETGDLNREGIHLALNNDRRRGDVVELEEKLFSARDLAEILGAISELCVYKFTIFEVWKDNRSHLLFELGHPDSLHRNSVADQCVC